MDQYEIGCMCMVFILVQLTDAVEQAILLYARDKQCQTRCQAESVVIVLNRRASRELIEKVIGGRNSQDIHGTPAIWPLLSSVVILGVPPVLNSGDQAEFEVGELHLRVDRFIGRDRKLLITSHVQRMDQYSHHNSR